VIHSTLKLIALSGTLLSALAVTTALASDKIAVPAEKFDLSHWYITLPTDGNKDGKVDTVSTKKLKERNLPKDDPNRTDIAYPVWGMTWDHKEDPGKAGIPLGEMFSYSVNVHENTMHLTFTHPERPVVKYSINLANNIDANGNVDALDNPYSYGGDMLYFKAGLYNQCSTKSAQQRSH